MLDGLLTQKINKIWGEKKMWVPPLVRSNFLTRPVGGKFPLVTMGSQVEHQAWADTEARTPMSASRIIIPSFWKYFYLITINSNYDVSVSANIHKLFICCFNYINTWMLICNFRILYPWLPTITGLSLSYWTHDPLHWKYGEGGGVCYQIANSSTLQPQQPTTAYPHHFLTAELGPPQQE